MKLVVYNNVPRVTGLPGDKAAARAPVQLLPGRNEIDADYLEAITKRPAVAALFDAKILTLDEPHKFPRLPQATEKDLQKIGLSFVASFAPAETTPAPAEVEPEPVAPELARKAEEPGERF